MKKNTVAVIVFLWVLSAGGAQFEINTAVFKQSYNSSVTADKAVIDTDYKKVSLYLTVAGKWLDKLDDLSLEMLNRHYLALMVESKLDLKGIFIYVRKSASEDYRSILEYLPDLPPVPVKEGVRAAVPKSLIPEKIYGNIEGGLSGKTVYVSPGHGWVYDTDSLTWGTQRGVTQGMREDDSNTEIVSYFLVPYLQNAGALVFSARETDRNENMVIVDDADGSSYPENGTYEENGTWAETASGKGYGRTDYPVDVNTKVFESGKYRYAAAGDGVWAKWTPNIPEEGGYHVYVSYKTYTDRAQKAVYTVTHAGGTTDITVNQQHHGSTWVDLGKFHFKKGMSGNVVLNKNNDAESGAVLIADAVRFGGGDALISRGSNTSGKPRWEEAAKLHAQFLGAPETVYQSSVNDRTSDVTARSRWAAWENEAGTDDPVFISWHSNAYNGNSRGISTYIYSSDDPGTTYVTTEAASGSPALAELVHNRILDAVKALFDPSWYEYGGGLYSAYFGEINPSYNNEMPSCLVELAFHDNAADSMMLRNPEFRDIAARAAYQAVVKYFADRDSYDPVYLPGPPVELRTEVTAEGSVTLFWEAPLTDAEFHLGHPATGYIVQKSLDGLSFDTGVDAGNVFQFTDEISEGPAYYRVIAYNDGGVSFPSVTSGVVYSSGRIPQILVVDGFERVDANTPRFTLGTSGSNRYILEYINSFDYFIEYAKVLVPLGFSVDYAQKSALSGVDLSEYDAVIWYSGEQSSADTTFSPSEQAVIAQFINEGGAFFASGSEIGWDLVEKGSTDDTLFYNEVLNVQYINDSSGLYTFKGTGDLSGLDGSFDDGTYFYQADYADVIEPFAVEGSQMMYYDEGSASGAGVLTSTSDKKVAVLGFPFETILNLETKKTIMAKVLKKFSISPAEIPDEDPDTEISDDSADDETTDEIDDSIAPDEASDEVTDVIPDEAADETADEKADESQDDSINDEDIEFVDGYLTDGDVPENEDQDVSKEPEKGKKGCSIVFI